MDGDFAELVNGDVAIEDCFDCGQDSRFDLGFAGGVDDGTDLFVRGGRHRDNNLFDMMDFGEFFELFDGAQDGNAVDAKAVLVGIIVEKRDGAVQKVAVFGDFAHERFAGVAGSDNEHVGTARGFCGAVDGCFAHDSQAAAGAADQC